MNIRTFLLVCIAITMATAFVAVHATLVSDLNILTSSLNQLNKLLTSPDTTHKIQPPPQQCLRATKPTTPSGRQFDTFNQSFNTLWQKIENFTKALNNIFTMERNQVSNYINNNFFKTEIMNNFRLSVQNLPRTLSQSSQKNIVGILTTIIDTYKNWIATLDKFLTELGSLYPVRMLKNDLEFDKRTLETTLEQFQEEYEESSSEEEESSSESEEFEEEL